MASERMTRFLCAADPQGDSGAVERLVHAADHHGAQAIALVGGLSGAASGEAAPAASYRKLFHGLGAAKRPAYWVPGPNDAPIVNYLREAHNIEVVNTMLRGLHGTAALTPDGHTVVAGFGGEVDDDPDAPRDEVERLRYPRWEPEYRLKIIHELDEHQVMLLFATPPAHKGRGEPGSEALTELIATYRARLVVTGGERNVELIGRSLVVAPGHLGDGHYAIADLQEQTAELQELAATA